ncbi:MAG: AI-2E family transporter [Chloroflexi bacterium]|nr:AI-2E family transporter [Chloroflexota bacterium]
MNQGFAPWRGFTELSPNHRKRLVLVVASVVVVFLLFYIARGALFPFVLGGIFAYVLFPAVKGLERTMPWRSRHPDAARVAAISVIYIAALAIVIGLLALIIPPAVRQSTSLIEDLPTIYTEAREAVEELVERFADDIPEDVRDKAEEILADLGDTLLSVAQTTLTKTLQAVANTFSFIIGLAIVPVLLFYLLKDGERLVASSLRIFPKNAGVHAREVVRIVNDSLGAYIRAQLLLMLFIGLFVFVGLLLLDIDFAILLGLVAGITEAIPVVGPIIGAVPGIIVTLATDPEKIVWVLALYLVSQLLENSLLVPRIQGNAVHMHPIVIMALLIVGSETFGVIGVVAAVPVASVAREVFKYFYGVWSDNSTTVPLEEAVENADTGEVQSDS